MNIAKCKIIFNHRLHRLTQEKGISDCVLKKVGTKISDFGLKKDKRMLKVESSKKGQEAIGNRR